MKEYDVVNHPSHYTDGKIEVIDFIDDKKLGFCLGNAVKYISRAGKKDPTKEIEDLEKAIWYIEHHIKNLQNKQQTLGKSKEIADKVDKTDKILEVKPIRGMRAKISTIDDVIPTIEFNKDTLESKLCNSLFELYHATDPNYTREQFEKDWQEVKDEIK